jgi:exodeoxyribonuclease VII small subunit
MDKKQTFESALRRLEELTKDLEGSEIGLDDMVNKYEESMKLAKYCMEKLAQAEQKIKILTGDDETSLVINDSDNDLPEV